MRDHKRGGRAEVDFSGTSRQARTCINATPLDAKTTVGVAFKYLFDPAGLVHVGDDARVDLVVPEGTIVSALPPDGAVFAYWEQNQVMISAMLRALAQALGPAAMAGDRGGADIHNANGVLPDGTPWVSAAQVGGEIGAVRRATATATPTAQMLSYQANGIGVAVEAVESDVPVVVLRHEIVAGHGGPGLHRGGASMVRDSLWLAPAEHHLMSLRYKRAARVRRQRRRRRGDAAGSGSGTDGERRPHSRTRRTPTATRRPSPASSIRRRTRRPRRRLPLPVPRAARGRRRPVALLRYVNHGGGGWGDPFEREPERVKRDVRDGYVTIEGAARDYGVVVIGDPDRRSGGPRRRPRGDRSGCGARGEP